MATLPCPTCQRPVEWTPAAKWRPFCSERCRLIDLGAWLTERHAIAGEDLTGESDVEADGPTQRQPGEPNRH